MAESPSTDSLGAKYLCIKLRTACILIGYFDLIGYPFIAVTYNYVQTELYGVNIPYTLINTIINCLDDLMIVFVSLLLILGVLKNKPKYIDIWIYFHLVFIVWCFVNITEGVMYVNISQLVFFMILLTWFIQVTFLVRAYKSFTSVVETEMMDREMKIASFGTISDRRKPFKIVHK